MSLNDCPRAHRWPEGPNEDIAQCPEPGCWGYTFALRPEGETFGEHLPDCCLPARHESYCQPGGAGHPPSQVVRGYWPKLYLVRYEIIDPSQPLTSLAMVSGTFTIAAETAEHAEELAELKARRDYADQMSSTNIHIGRAQLASEVHAQASKPPPPPHAEQG